jgi:hypothetical protein
MFEEIFGYTWPSCTDRHGQLVQLSSPTDWIMRTSFHNHKLHRSQGWKPSPSILALKQINLPSNKFILWFIISVIFITNSEILKLYAECKNQSSTCYGHVSLSSMLILFFCFRNKFLPFMNSVRRGHIF